ncbi:MAG: hypothetical protein K9H49_02735 [Bacteroidales bacterium]|nr:hypothetical protein [Bacteroidales bacterium]MCF8389174.1 hypothetical protein [Bacteroidales bacterium]
MKKHILKLYLLLLFVFPVWQVSAQQYGLKFSSYDSLQELRTGLNLFPEKEYVINKDFSLNFDLSSYPSVSSYGYIFRAILEGDNNVDLILGALGDERRTLSLIHNSDQTGITYEISAENLTNNWVNIGLHFQMAEDRILLQVLDTVIIHENLGFKNHSKFKLFFGACFEKNFSSTDVPPIIVRDIKIERGSKLIHHWPLNEFEGDRAKDIMTFNYAEVVNPDWLLYGHMYWKKNTSFKLSGFAKIVSDKSNDVLYILGQKMLLKYDLSTNFADTIRIYGDSLILTPNNQAVLDGQNILVYNPNNKQIVKVETKSGEVKRITPNLPARKNFLHHNKFMDHRNHMLYILNGYGHFTYRNELIQYNVAENIWRNLEEPENKYEPRYLAACGYLNDTLYVLGGYGSASGNQRLNPQYFYDLNTISLSDFKYERKWEYEGTKNDYCFVNSLEIEGSSRSFYTLIFSKSLYNSKLKLIRGYLDHNTIEYIGNPIEYKFNDINSYADLYYSSKLGKLVVYELYSKEYTSSDIQLYSIDYPPLAISLPVSSPIKNKLMIAIIALIIGFSVAVLIIRRKRGKIKIKESKQLSGILKEDIKKNNQSNAIFFFGGFQVINRDYVDITRKFTQLVKELFLLILFKSISENSKGISAEKLVENLWFDKSPKSGRNNLSVNIAKLKEILKELDGIELSHETSYWRLKIDPKKIFVEYQIVYNILDGEKADISSEALCSLLGASNNGQFLLNLSYEWLDSYKGQLSDKMVDTLINYAGRLDPNINSALIIQICDSVFNFDTVNEEAVVLKCRAQSLVGKHSIAKSTYENFCREYLMLYGEKFGRSFGSITNELDT